LRLWKFPDQVIRLIVIFALLLGGLLFLRHRFIPESFGELGHFRANAIPAIAGQAPRYAGAGACVECHEEEGKIKQASYHRNVGCETCHGAGAAHADAPDETTPIRPTRREDCLRCHQYEATRPTGFPQVISSLHNPNKLCITCHNPHDPTPPETPSTCGACHATVARTKAVSHHANLECTTCHETSPRHREDPRAFLPKKPATREFCGQCHAKDAHGMPEAPRVDMAEHGGRYVCWQCHYPHYPEGR